MNLAARYLAVAVTLGQAVAGQPAWAQGAAEVPSESWYPEGYLDLRIAAAEHVATFPRDERQLLSTIGDDGATTAYDVIDCYVSYQLPAGYNPELDWSRAVLAVYVASRRAELIRLGYSPEVFEQPLLDFERKSLHTIEAAREAWARANEQAARAATRENPVNSRDPVTGSPVSMPGPVPVPVPEDLPHVDYGELASALEARREQLQPDRPPIAAAHACSPYADEVMGVEHQPVVARGPDDGFTFYLRPRNGQLRLVNAFAFQICQRKVANPWQDVSCGWRNYSDGEFTAQPGRYMYEVRWPDGTVQRGAKILENDARGQFTSHTFRRD